MDDGLYSQITTCEHLTVLAQAYYKFPYGPNSTENGENSPYLLIVMGMDCEVEFILFREQLHG